LLWLLLLYNLDGITESDELVDESKEPDIFESLIAMTVLIYIVAGKIN